MTRQTFESLKIGDKVDYLIRDDFSGKIAGYYAGVVSAVENDHCIVSADDLIRFQDFTEDMCNEIAKER